MISVRTVKLKPARGFTLLELLIVTAILASVVVIAFGIFTSILSAANRINISTEIKQNAQIAVDLLERNLRAGIHAVNPTGDESILEIRNQQGQIVRFSCVAETTTENGYLMFERQNETALPVTNQDRITGVSITQCKLKVVDGLSSTSPKIVLIDIAFEQAVAAPARADFLAGTRFNYAISLRNYQ